MKAGTKANREPCDHLSGGHQEIVISYSPSDNNNNNKPRTIMFFGVQKIKLDYEITVMTFQERTVELTT